MLAVVAESLRRELFDVTIPFDESGGGFGPDAGNAGVAVGAVADQGEIIRNECRRNAELFAHTLLVTDLPALSIHLHHALAHDALSQILVRRPDADFLH